MSQTSPQDRSLVRELIVAVFLANGAIVISGDQLVANLNLTSSLWQVLDALERSAETLTVAEIARSMGLARQSVQRSADLLSKQGLVTYQHNPMHKRANLVCLNAAGRRMLASVHALEFTAIDHVLAQLSPESVATATSVLAVLTEELFRQIDAGEPL